MSTCRLSLALLLGMSLSVAPLRAADLTRVYEIDELKSTEAALSYLDRMTLDPTQRYEGQLLRGVLLAKLGRTSEAQHAFERLREGDPDRPEAPHNLAILDAMSGKRAAAILALEEILEHYPSYDSARANLESIHADSRTEQGLEGPDKVRTRLFLTAKPGLYRRVESPPPAVVEAPPPSSPQARVQPGASEAGTLSPANPREELRRVVEAWAQAWSQQRVEGYLQYYASDFQPPADSTREAWEARRRDRIATPKFIEVDIDFDSLEMWPIGPDEMGVRFVQRYRSDRFSDTVRKTLGLVREAGAWRIRSEISQ